MSRYVDLDGLTWDGTPITSKIQEVKTKCGYMSGITSGWLWSDGVPHIDLEEHDKQTKVAVIDTFCELVIERIESKNRGLYVSEAIGIAEQLKEDML